MIGLNIRCTRKQLPQVFQPPFRTFCNLMHVTVVFALLNFYHYRCQVCRRWVLSANATLGPGVRPICDILTASFKHRPRTSKPWVMCHLLQPAEKVPRKKNGFRPMSSRCDIRYRLAAGSIVLSESYCHILSSETMLVVVADILDQYLHIHRPP